MKPSPQVYGGAVAGSTFFIQRDLGLGCERVGSHMLARATGSAVGPQVRHVGVSGGGCSYTCVARQLFDVCAAKYCFLASNAVSPAS